MRQFFTFLFVVLIAAAGYTALGEYGYHDYWVPVEFSSQSKQDEKKVEINIDLENLSEQTNELLKAGKVKQSVDHLNEKLKNLKDNQRKQYEHKILFLLGKGYEKLGQDKKARQKYTAYLEKRPDTDRKAEVLYRIGKTHSEDLAKRESYFRRAVKEAPYGDVAENVAKDYESAIGTDPGPVKKLLHLSLRFRHLTESGTGERKQLYKKLQKASDNVFKAGETYLDAEEYQVQSGDLLSKIADKFQVGMGWINYTNHRSLPVTGPHAADIATRLRPGDRLIIYPGTLSMDVYKSDFKLSLFYNDIYFVTSYPVGIGKGGGEKTPTGSYKVTDKSAKPAWTHPETGEVLSYQDPDNILGTRWIGINLSGYGIHGVNEEKNDTIGTASSMGCIRMKNVKCETVYDMIPNGIPSLSEDRVPTVRILE